MLRSIIVLVGALVFFGCASGPRGVPQFTKIGSYALNPQSADPRAAWSPDGSVVAVASQNGVGFLKENSQRRQFFELPDMRPAGHVCWLDEDTLLVGARDLVRYDEQGQLCPHNDPLLILDWDGSQCVLNRALEVYGYRPRAWDDRRFVVQQENHILLVDDDGDSEEYDKGFYPEPQWDGPGIAFQTTPVISTDHWTGLPRVDHLQVRWRPGKVSLIPGCVQPSWCPDGGLLATRVLGTVPEQGPWWQGGTDVVHIAAGSDDARVLAAGGRLAVANPHWPVAAYVAADDRIHILALDGSMDQDLKVSGRDLCWSPEGRRLLYFNTDDKDRPVLRVLVFEVKGSDQ